MNITLLDELPTLVHQGLERCKISGSYHIPIQFAYLASTEDR